MIFLDIFVKYHTTFSNADQPQDQLLLLTAMTMQLMWEVMVAVVGVEVW